MKMQKLNKKEQNNLKLDSNTKSNINIKQTENGRSMVEMLGVLSIMGVLTVGALNMYDSSMIKSQTNDLLKEGLARATTVSTQLLTNRDPDLTEFKNNKIDGGTFGTDVVLFTEDNQFGISVSDVSQEVCEKLNESISEWTPLRALTDSEGTDLTSCDTTEFLMVYNYDNGAVDEEGSGEVCDASKHQIDDGAGGCKCEDGYKLEGGECSEDLSSTFVAGARGSWNNLNNNAGSITNHGCPDGYLILSLIF